ncbi:uncharacterized protein LOC124163373 [Ischnura elegans]|uniref:uncharacterized protein LOC124163373 n=1 Tax=Ischnura elegans TaxID=197161 RepID=UPI001ED86EB5|nr:uncharacterized protein LOC124163373 [Ischnura elegans]
MANRARMSKRLLPCDASRNDSIQEKAWRDAGDSSFSTPSDDTRYLEMKRSHKKSSRMTTKDQVFRRRVLPSGSSADNSVEEFKKTEKWWEFLDDESDPGARNSNGNRSTRESKSFMSQRTSGSGFSCSDLSNASTNMSRIIPLKKREKKTLISPREYNMAICNETTMRSERTLHQTADANISSFKVDSSHEDVSINEQAVNINPLLNRRPLRKLELSNNFSRVLPDVTHHVSHVSDVSVTNSVYGQGVEEYEGPSTATYCKQTVERNGATTTYVTISEVKERIQIQNRSCRVPKKNSAFDLTGAVTDITANSDCVIVQHIDSSTRQSFRFGSMKTEGKYQDTNDILIENQHASGSFSDAEVEDIDISDLLNRSGPVERKKFKSGRVRDERKSLLALCPVEFEEILSERSDDDASLDEHDISHSTSPSEIHELSGGNDLHKYNKNYGEDSDHTGDKSPTMVERSGRKNYKRSGRKNFERSGRKSVVRSGRKNLERSGRKKFPENNENYSENDGLSGNGGSETFERSGKKTLERSGRKIFAENNENYGEINELSGSGSPETSERSGRKNLEKSGRKNLEGSRRGFERSGRKNVERSGRKNLEKSGRKNLEGSRRSFERSGRRQLSDNYENRGENNVRLSKEQDFSSFDADGSSSIYESTKLEIPAYPCFASKRKRGKIINFDTFSDALNSESLAISQNSPDENVSGNSHSSYSSDANSSKSRKKLFFANEINGKNKPDGAMEGDIMPKKGKRSSKGSSSSKSDSVESQDSRVLQSSPALPKKKRKTLPVSTNAFNDALGDSNDDVGQSVASGGNSPSGENDPSSRDSNNFIPVEDNMLIQHECGPPGKNVFHDRRMSSLNQNSISSDKSLELDMKRNSCILSRSRGSVKEASVSISQFMNALDSDSKSGNTSDNANSKIYATREEHSIKSSINDKTSGTCKSLDEVSSFEIDDIVAPSKNPLHQRERRKKLAPSQGSAQLALAIDSEERSECNVSKPLSQKFEGEPGGRKSINSFSSETDRLPTLLNKYEDCRRPGAARETEAFLDSKEESITECQSLGSDICDEMQASSIVTRRGRKKGNQSMRSSEFAVALDSDINAETGELLMEPLAQNSAERETGNRRESKVLEKASSSECAKKDESVSSDEVEVAPPNIDNVSQLVVHGKKRGNRTSVPIQEDVYAEAVECNDKSNSRSFHSLDAVSEGDRKERKSEEPLKIDKQSFNVSKQGESDNSQSLNEVSHVSEIDAANISPVILRKRKRKNDVKKTDGEDDVVNEDLMVNGSKLKIDKSQALKVVSNSDSLAVVESSGISDHIEPVFHRMRRKKTVFPINASAFAGILESDESECSNIEGSSEAGEGRNGIAMTESILKSGKLEKTVLPESEKVIEGGAASVDCSSEGGQGRKGIAMTEGILKSGKLEKTVLPESEKVIEGGAASVNCSSEGGQGRKGIAMTESILKSGKLEKTVLPEIEKVIEGGAASVDCSSEGGQGRKGIAMSESMLKSGKLDKTVLPEIEKVIEGGAANVDCSSEGGKGRKGKAMSESMLKSGKLEKTVLLESEKVIEGGAISVEDHPPKSRPPEDIHPEFCAHEDSPPKNSPSELPCHENVPKKSESLIALGDDENLPVAAKISIENSRVPVFMREREKKVPLNINESVFAGAFTSYTDSDNSSSSKTSEVVAENQAEVHDGGNSKTVTTSVEIPKRNGISASPISSNVGSSMSGIEEKTSQVTMKKDFKPNLPILERNGGKKVPLHISSSVFSGVLGNVLESSVNSVPGPSDSVLTGKEDDSFVPDNEYAQANVAGCYFESTRGFIVLDAKSPFSRINKDLGDVSSILTDSSIEKNPLEEVSNAVPSVKANDSSNALKASVSVADVEVMRNLSNHSASFDIVNPVPLSLHPQEIAPIPIHSLLHNSDLKVQALSPSLSRVIPDVASLGFELRESIRPLSMSPSVSKAGLSPSKLSSPSPPEILHSPKEGCPGEILIADVKEPIHASPTSSVERENVAQSSDKAPIEPPDSSEPKNAVLSPVKGPIEPPDSSEPKNVVPSPVKDPIGPPDSSELKNVVPSPVKDPIEPPDSSELKNVVPSPVKGPIKPLESTQTLEQPPSRINPRRSSARGISAIPKPIIPAGSKKRESTGVNKIAPESLRPALSVKSKLIRPSTENLLSVDKKSDTVKSSGAPSVPLPAKMNNTSQTEVQSHVSELSSAAKNSAIHCSSPSSVPKSQLQTVDYLVPNTSSEAHQNVRPAINDTTFVKEVAEISHEAKEIYNLTFIKSSSACEHVPTNIVDVSTSAVISLGPNAVEEAVPAEDLEGRTSVNEASGPKLLAIKPVSLFGVGEPQVISENVVSVLAGVNIQTNISPPKSTTQIEPKSLATTEVVKYSSDDKIPETQNVNTILKEIDDVSLPNSTFQLEPQVVISQCEVNMQSPKESVKLDPPNCELPPLMSEISVDEQESHTSDIEPAQASHNVSGPPRTRSSLSVPEKVSVSLATEPEKENSELHLKDAFPENSVTDKLREMSSNTTVLLEGNLKAGLRKEGDDFTPASLPTSPECEPVHPVLELQFHDINIGPSPLPNKPKENQTSPSPEAVEIESDNGGKEISVIPQGSNSLSSEVVTTDSEKSANTSVLVEGNIKAAHEKEVDDFTPASSSTSPDCELAHPVLEVPSNDINMGPSSLPLKSDENQKDSMPIDLVSDTVTSEEGKSYANCRNPVSIATNPEEPVKAICDTNVISSAVTSPSSQAEETESDKLAAIIMETSCIPQDLNSLSSEVVNTGSEKPAEPTHSSVICEDSNFPLPASEEIRLEKPGEAIGSSTCHSASQSLQEIKLNLPSPSKGVSGHNITSEEIKSSGFSAVKHATRDKSGNLLSSTKIIEKVGSITMSSEPMHAANEPRPSNSGEVGFKYSNLECDSELLMLSPLNFKQLTSDSCGPSTSSSVVFSGQLTETEFSTSALKAASNSTLPSTIHSQSSRDASPFQSSGLVESTKLSKKSPHASKSVTFCKLTSKDLDDQSSGPIFKGDKSGEVQGERAAEGECQYRQASAPALMETRMRSWFRASDSASLMKGSRKHSNLVVPSRGEVSGPTLAESRSEGSMSHSYERLPHSHAVSQVLGAVPKLGHSAFRHSEMNSMSSSRDESVARRGLIDASHRKESLVKSVMSKTSSSSLGTESEPSCSYHSSDESSRLTEKSSRKCDDSNSSNPEDDVGRIVDTVLRKLDEACEQQRKLEMKRAESIVQQFASLLPVQHTLGNKKKLQSCARGEPRNLRKKRDPSEKPVPKRRLPAWCSKTVKKVFVEAMEGREMSFLDQEKYLFDFADTVKLVIKSKDASEVQDGVISVQKQLFYLNIVKTLGDFFQFVRTYLPYEFRCRSIPCTGWNDPIYATWMDDSDLNKPLFE